MLLSLGFSHIPSCCVDIRFHPQADKWQFYDFPSVRKSAQRAWLLGWTWALKITYIELCLLKEITSVHKNTHAELDFHIYLAFKKCMPVICRRMHNLVPRISLLRGWRMHMNFQRLRTRISLLEELFEVTFTLRISLRQTHLLSSTLVLYKCDSIICFTVLTKRSSFCCSSGILLIKIRLVPILTNYWAKTGLLVTES